MDLKGDRSMYNTKAISIMPKPDCKTCDGSGMMKADLVPAPFGPGMISLPEEFCHCVIDQLPPEGPDFDADNCEIFLRFSEPEKNNEEWEIAIGGNFLQIWEAGTYATMEILDFDNGKVAEVELPNYRKLDINASDAINMVMPRAHLIVRAPAMLRLLKKLAPLIEREADMRDEANTPDDDSLEGIKGYHTEMREAFNEIMAEVARAHGREMPEPAEIAEPETCEHGYGFVEQCPTCKDRKNDDEALADDYDYAADDRNFDAARERNWKR
jgi:hypothetical protein